MAQSRFAIGSSRQITLFAEKEPMASPETVAAAVISYVLQRGTLFSASCDSGLRSVPDRLMLRLEMPFWLVVRPFAGHGVGNFRCQTQCCATSVSLDGGPSFVVCVTEKANGFNRSNESGRGRF